MSLTPNDEIRELRELLQGALADLDAERRKNERAFTEHHRMFRQIEELTNERRRLEARHARCPRCGAS